MFSKLLPLSLMLLLLAQTPGRAQNAGADADNRQRTLLVFAPSRSDPRWRRQDALLRGSAAAFRERDLRRADIFAGSGSRSAAFGKRYHVKPGRFRVLLIGKDGHVAFSTLSPVASGEINARIDRMPMRRDEMRQRGRGR